MESITGIKGALALDSLPAGLIGSTPDTIELSFDPAALAAGIYEYSLTVDLLDEDLPGAASSQLTIDLGFEVSEGSGSPADLNNDGEVNGLDLTILLGAWGSSNNDLTGDGVVSGPDLAQLLAAWGS